MKKNDKFKPLVVIQCYEDRQQTLPLRKEPAPATLTNGNVVASKTDVTDSPPPPPPMPTTNGVHNGQHKEDIHKTIRHSFSDMTLNSSVKKNGTLMRTPTPDYNNKIETVPIKIKNGKDDKAELDSLESFKLKNPSNVQPKPPHNYFVRAPNGTATMKKHGRPVSVTIGEYGSGGGLRREPSKLEFLNGDKPDGAAATEDASISNRLQSELVLTLSRSNLRKKTEAMGDAGR